MRTRATSALAAVVLVSTAASGAWCGAPKPTEDGTPEAPYEVPEVVGPVHVDGVLDEGAWDEALALDLVYETSPGENTEARVRTEVLLAYSRTHLYVAFRAYDPDPPRICANITDRDNMYDDDRLSFILDTFNDHRRGYMFFVNPFGIQGDALDSSGMGGGDPVWDTIWDSEGCITEFGYAVEVSVPFSSLRFQRSQGKQVWGIGLGRKYSRDFDYRMALMPRDRDETCYLCQVAKFSGFEGVTPGRNIEFDP
ncbi:MAG: carbohydrate binding family 9 domain-containing protein, partial [Candidatus Eisenbacteria bacterium]|nr:carbohydrate binding family 9 domain-containing protein [Candidatus Eisenbacteria bacterium]